MSRRRPSNSSEQCPNGRRWHRRAVHVESGIECAARQAAIMRRGVQPAKCRTSLLHDIMLPACISALCRRRIGVGGHHDVMTYDGVISRRAVPCLVRPVPRDTVPQRVGTGARSPGKGRHHACRSPALRHSPGRRPRTLRSRWALISGQPHCSAHHHRHPPPGLQPRPGPRARASPSLLLPAPPLFNGSPPTGLPRAATFPPAALPKSSPGTT
jgi:hypothetical protein